MGETVLLERSTQLPTQAEGLKHSKNSECEVGRKGEREQGMKVAKGSVRHSKR